MPEKMSVPLCFRHFCSHQALIICLTTLFYRVKEVQVANQPQAFS